MARSRLRHYYRHGLLPQLVAFEACLRLGSVTRAAEELALAQPTVSGLLKKLSDTMGGPVLQMRDGRMQLTKTGEEVAVLCEEMLSALERHEERRAQREEPRPTYPAWALGSAAAGR